MFSKGLNSHGKRAINVRATEVLLYLHVEKICSQVRGEANKCGLLLTEENIQENIHKINKTLHLNITFTKCIIGHL